MNGWKINPFGLPKFHQILLLISLESVLGQPTKELIKLAGTEQGERIDLEDDWHKNYPKLVEEKNKRLKDKVGLTTSKKGL